MRSLIAIAAFIFYAGLSALPARADFMNGRGLAGLCASDVDWEYGGCIGYIVGVADAFDHLHLSSTDGGKPKPIASRTSACRFSRTSYESYVSP